MSTMTMDDVEEMKDRRQEVAEKLDTFREREEQLSSELAHLHAAGDGDSEEAEKAQEERRQVRDELSDLEAALDVLDERIVEATEEAATNEAADQIDHLRKRVGGISGQHEDDLEKAAELLERGVETLLRAESNRRRQLHLRGLAEALADRFGHDVGEFKTLDPADVRQAKALRERIVSRLEGGPPRPTDTGPVPDVPGIEPATRTAHASIALRRGWGEETPRAVELLELVGEDVQHDPHEVRQAKSGHENRKQEEAAQEAAREFLEERVSGSPTPIPRLFDEFRRLDLPGESEKNDGNLMSAAARDLEFVRVKNPGGLHHYAPPGFEPDGETWRKARIGDGW